MLLGSPLYFAAQKHPAMLRDTGEEGEMYSLSLLLRFYEPHPAMLRGTAGKKWNHTEFSFGFISDIKKEVSQINGILPRMI